MVASTSLHEKEELFGNTNIEVIKRILLLILFPLLFPLLQYRVTAVEPSKMSYHRYLCTRFRLFFLFLFLQEQFMSM